MYRLQKYMLLLLHTFPQVLTGRDPSSQEVSVGSLSLSHSRQLITQHLKSSSVPAYTALVDILLGKLGICNPLFAIELVRYLERKANSSMEIMDEDDELKEIARSLPDDLTKSVTCKELFLLRF